MPSDTTNTGTPAAAPDLGQELLADGKQALSDAALAALKIYQPILLNAVTAVQAAPSVDEVVAQAVQTESQILTAFPQLEQAEIAALAADVKTTLTQVGTIAVSAATNIGQSASSSTAASDSTGTQNAG